VVKLLNLPGESKNRFRKPCRIYIALLVPHYTTVKEAGKWLAALRKIRALMG